MHISLDEDTFAAGISLTPSVALLITSEGRNLNEVVLVCNSEELVRFNVESGPISDLSAALAALTHYNSRQLNN